MPDQNKDLREGERRAGETAPPKETSLEGGGETLSEEAGREGRRPFSDEEKEAALAALQRQVLQVPSDAEASVPQITELVGAGSEASADRSLDMVLRKQAPPDKLEAALIVAFGKAKNLETK